MKKTTVYAALVLSFATILKVAAGQAPQATTTQTPQATQSPVTDPAASVAGTAKTPGNIWLPAKKATSSTAALTPEEELKTFSMPPGYHVQLVAAEPLIESPIIIDFDPDGRMW